MNIANTGAMGDVTVRAPDPAWWIDSFPQGRDRPPSPSDLPPSSLLTAQNEVVAFTARAQELSALQGWRDAGAHQSVRLLHGPGGQGKTRLAGEFAARTRSAGWQVTRAHHRGDAAPRADLIEPDDLRGDLLVVVDYAERWPLHDLRSLVAAVARSPVGRVRVLLLARSSGLWWRATRHELERLGAGVDDLVLGLLAEDRDARSDAFSLARDRFAELYSIDDPAGIATPASIDEEGFGHALTVQMAALASVDAQVRGEATPVDINAVSKYLLDREVAHWHRLYAGGVVAAPPAIMARLVWVAALTGPLGHRDALRTLHRCDVVEQGSDPLADHGVLYPPWDTSTALQPLLPDRLAEDLLAGLWGAGDRSFDPWFGEALGRLLDPDGDGYPAFAGRALAVVVEIARRWPAVASLQLDPLLRADPGLAPCARGSTLVDLADVVSPDVLEGVEARLPQVPSLDHDAAAAEIGLRVLDRPKDRDDPVELGRRLIRLSGRLRNVGRHQEAVAAAVRAEKLLTRVDGHNENLDADLALALVCQDVALAELGDPEQALQRSLRALEINLRLSETSPKRYMPRVATALTNIGHRLSQLGDNPAAVLRTREAVRIFRELADEDPKWYPDLGWALTNLGAQFADQSRHSDALPHTQDAITILDLFAEMNPTVEPDLARALGNHAAQLTATGRAAEAVVPAERAVAILERWSEHNPAYWVQLGLALLKAAGVLAIAGHRDRALEYAERSEALFRRLVLTGEQPAANLRLASDMVADLRSGRIPTQRPQPNRATRRRAARSRPGR